MSTTEKVAVVLLAAAIITWVGIGVIIIENGQRFRDWLDRGDKK